MGEPSPAQRVADTALGVAGAAAPVVGAVARRGWRTASKIWSVAARPPLVPERWTLGHFTDQAEIRGRAMREQASIDLAETSTRLGDALVPLVAHQVLSRLETIDLSQVRLDPTQLEQALDVVVPFTVEATLSRLDPLVLIENHIRLEQIEKLLDAHLADVLALTLSQLDLTAIVRENVDLVGLTNDVVDQVDLAGITQNVIDEIDLQAIIRESTSGIAGDVVNGTRASAATADEFIASFFGRRRPNPPGATV